MIDEFGFDRIERGECPQAASLFYKVIDARSGRRSTALATNIDFEAWSEYLGDPPLAMAFLDRVVDGAILLKIRGKSYHPIGPLRRAPNDGQLTPSQKTVGPGFFAHAVFPTIHDIRTVWGPIRPTSVP